MQVIAEKIQTKVCSKCGVEKALSAFSKDRQKKDGLRPSCKECGRKTNNPEFFKKNKIKKQLFKDGFKICSTCGHIKPLKSFYKNNDSVDGYLYQCIDCRIPNSKEIENKRLAESGSRKCYRCGKILSLDKFHKTSKNKIGRRTVCIQCRRDEWTKPSAIKEKINRQLLFDQGLKTCSKCKKTKHVEEFGLSNSSKWKVTPECKQCSLLSHDEKSTKLYYQNNKDKLKLKAKESNNSPSKSKIFFKQLPITDGPQIDIDGYITVVCHFCNKVFRPKNSDIKNRIGAIKGQKRGVYHFYCSDRCKESCFSYHFNPSQTDPRSKLYVPKTEAEQARSAQTDKLKKAQCDKHGYNYCERCGDIIDVELHHTLPVSEYGLQAVDGDSHILLCPGCHVALHGECA